MTSRELTPSWEEQNWLPWPFDDEILVSDCGNVLSYKNRWKHRRCWHDLRQHVLNSGYLAVSISGQGPGLVPVHRLVAQTWIVNQNPGVFKEVNHRDGDKWNNHRENLEWTTRSKNVQHSYDTRLRSAPNRIKIEVLETGEIFDSMLDAARALGVHQGDISNMLKNKVKHVRGYRFRRVE